MKTMIIPAEQQEEIEQQKKEIQARLERATRLHLEGHTSYEQFLEEKLRGQADPGA